MASTTTSGEHCAERREQSGLRYYGGMNRRLALALLTAFVMIVGACSGGDGEASTTTSGDDGTVTSLGAAGGGDTEPGPDTTAAGAAATTTTLSGGAPAIPQFEIVQREPGDEGDIVVVLLDPTSYETLTDIDLQNVIAEVVEDFPPVYEVHVIDDERVAGLVEQDELTPEEQQLLDLYYLAHLDEGFRISFEGPFSDVASTVLGS